MICLHVCAVYWSLKLVSSILFRNANCCAMSDCVCWACAQLAMGSWLQKYVCRERLRIRSRLEAGVVTTASNDVWVRGWHDEGPNDEPGVVQNRWSGLWAMARMCRASYVSASSRQPCDLLATRAYWAGVCCFPPQRSDYVSSLWATTSFCLFCRNVCMFFDRRLYSSFYGKEDQFTLVQVYIIINEACLWTVRLLHVRQIQPALRMSEKHLVILSCPLICFAG